MTSWHAGGIPAEYHFHKHKGRGRRGEGGVEGSAGRNTAVLHPGSGVTDRAGGMEGD